jgi:centrosomal protein CEP104
VKDYLPVDDEKTRKNTMWRLLFEYFDQIDGKPSKSDIKVIMLKKYLQHHFLVSIETFQVM